MKKETLYIIDPDNFKGTVINTMNNGHVDYMDEPTTFDEYKQDKGNENLIALTWDEFDEKYYKSYLDSLCGKWKEITKGDYWDNLEVLPPVNWTLGRIEFFFCSERWTANISNCSVKVGNRYFSALMDMSASMDEIEASLLNVFPNLIK